MKNSHDSLELIYSATEKISQYITGYSPDQFLADSKTQSAAIMQLVVIGELCKKLDETVVSQIDLPWKLMAGFRDFAVHEYFALDLEKVWDTLTVDIPEVSRKISEFLASHP